MNEEEWCPSAFFNSETKQQIITMNMGSLALGGPKAPHENNRASEKESAPCQQLLVIIMVFYSHDDSTC